MSEESTTPDLAELWRRSVQLENLRDYDAAMRFWARDGALNLSLTALGTYESHAAIRAFLEAWVGAIDDFQFELEELHDLFNGVAFALVVSTARPAGSTGSVQGRWGSVSIWGDGLRERVTNYFDIDEVRTAAQQLAEQRG